MIYLVTFERHEKSEFAEGENFRYPPDAWISVNAYVCSHCGEPIIARLQTVCPHCGINMTMVIC